ncbi:MAG: hypothetical protein QW478_07745 [Candidatus Micrarchaeaceae archaeon]
MNKYKIIGIIIIGIVVLIGLLQNALITIAIFTIIGILYALLKSAHRTKKHITGDW